MIDMNVYLDIDGVLLANNARLASHADEFLQAIINKYPDSTYWLTMPNDQGMSTNVLAPHLRPETVAMLDKIKPLEWKTLKTEAIDFNKDFLWFGDDIWPEELNALEKHDAVQQFIMVKLDKNPDILEKLTQVIEDNK